MFKLSCSYDSGRFLLLKILTEWVINCSFCVNFQFPTMFNTGAGAASRYGSGSDQKMQILAAPAPAPQQC
jgi:hypothetical protein